MPLERSVRTSAAKASARTDVQALTEKEPMMMVASAAGAEIRTDPIIARRQPPKPKVPTKPIEGTKPKRAFSSTASSQFRSKVCSTSYMNGNHGKVMVKDLGRALAFIPSRNHLPFAINQIDSDDSEICPTQATQILPSRVRVQSQSYLSGYHQGDSTELSQRRSQPDIASSESVILPKSSDYLSYLRGGKPIQLHYPYNAEPGEVRSATQTGLDIVVDIDSSGSMTDTEMSNGGAPKVKRGRGRPRKSESEKAETAAKRAAKTKAERAERKAQQRLQAQAVTHGHPPPSTTVPNTVPLPQKSRDTHQLLLCGPGMTNSHSHPETASGDARFTLGDIAAKLREQDEIPAMLFGRRSASREGPMGVPATTSPPAGHTSSPAPAASMQIAQADRGMIYSAQPDQSVPVSTLPVLTTAPVSVPSMQKAQADGGVIYLTEADEEAPAPAPPANTGVERVSQSSTTPTGSPGEDQIRNLMVGGKNPRNEKQYRLLSNDMLVKKLQRAEPGLPCNWCSAPKNNDFGDLTPTSTDLSKRIICDYCIKSVLCKIEHANHGKWSPLVSPPQIASPQCDVCLGRHAVVICGDCPLRVCTVCQLSLDETWEASGNLDRMIENLHWLAVRDDAIFLHSESREFPSVLQQLTPPTRHLVKNRFGDNEYLTDAEIEADNILAEIYGSFPLPTLTPEAKYDEYGHYMGGLDEEGLLPHQEFHYCDPSVFNNLQ